MTKQLTLIATLSAAVALSACGTSQTNIAPVGNPPGPLPDRTLAQRDLLYVTNKNGTVSVYTYWQHTLVRVLSNFKLPMGACAAPNQDVYILDNQAEKIYEYGHNGKKPLRSIYTAPWMPYSCSVAPLTGDLAVGNRPYDSSGSGSLAIYRQGTGKPIIFRPLNSTKDRFTGCAYDDRGDLFAMSAIAKKGYWYYDFYYLPAHGKALLPIKVPGIHYGSFGYGIHGIAWDGQYWVVGPYVSSLNLYTIDVKARQVGTVTLGGSYVFIGPLAFYRAGINSRAQQVAGASGPGGSAETLEYWSYPGGTFIYQIARALDGPFGVAISLRTQ